MTVTAAAARLIMKQLQEVQKADFEGIQLQPTEDIQEIEAVIQGPEGTPFAGGSFLVTLVLGEDYPAAPPKGFFKTRIFHPNISERGEICVNTLKKDWTPDCGLTKVLTVIRCLLIQPNPESALNEEAGKLFMEEYAEYSKRARSFTIIHAMTAEQQLKAAAAAAAAQQQRIAHGDEENESSAQPSKQIQTNNNSNQQQQQHQSLRTIDNTNTMQAAPSSANPPSSSSMTTTGGGTEKKAADKKRAALKRL